MSDDVLLELFSEDADAGETEQLTQSLRRELLDLREVDDVARVSAGPAPPGSRGVDMAALGALVVSISPGVDLLGKVLRVVQDWMKRGQKKSHTMRITIQGQSLELTATAAQQQQLVEQFLASVQAPEES